MARLPLSLHVGQTKDGFGIPLLYIEGSDLTPLTEAPIGRQVLDRVIG